MNPVRGHTMLNFLHWMGLHRPDVKRLRGLSEPELLQLANDFERGKLISMKTQTQVGGLLLLK